jgi:hypothetical protein
MALTIAAQLGVLLLLGVRDGVREGSAIAINKVPYANLSLSLSLSICIYYLFVLFCVTHWTRLCSYAHLYLATRVGPLPAVTGTMLRWSEQAKAMEVCLEKSGNQWDRHL